MRLRCVFFLLCLLVSSGSISHACKIIWMHPPLTPPTFCLSIQHVCNATLFEHQVSVGTEVATQHGCTLVKPGGTSVGSREHSPIRQDDVYSDAIISAVTVLREPTERLLEAFLDYAHEDGLSSELKIDLMADMDYGDGRAHRKDWKRNWMVGDWGSKDNLCIYNFNKYISYPASIGCYTKMLNGYRCNQNITLDFNMVEEGIARLRRFFFVGLTDNYSLSVMIFLNKSFYHSLKSVLNDTVGVANATNKHVSLLPHHYELAVKTDHVHKCSSVLYRLLEANQLNYTDPYDSIVYKEAVKLFVEERRKYESHLPVR